VLLVPIHCLVRVLLPRLLFTVTPFTSYLELADSLAGSCFIWITWSRSRNRSLLPAISLHGHSWHRAPLGSMAIDLFSVKTCVFSSFLDPSNITSRVIWPPRDPHRKLRSIIGTCLPNYCIATVAALTAWKTSHMIPSQRIYWYAACCPATSNKHSYIYCCMRFNMFTELLPSNALAIHVTVLTLLASHPMVYGTGVS
jgi:hypothetical protein